MATLLTFFTTHDALRAERVLLERGLKPGIVPTPRFLSSECGFALLIEAADSAVADQARAAGLRIEACYRTRQDKGETTYERAD